MSLDADADDQAAFEQSISDCMRDLDALLPELARRYDRSTIVSAMAEHVGSALLILRRKNVCDDYQAEQAIQHLVRAAFPSGQPVEPKIEKH